MIDMETIIMELVVNGGNGRSKALQAIRAARNNQMEQAEALMKECNDSIAKAHEFQTELLQKSLDPQNEGAASVNLLVVHGQDHLMDAMVIRDLAVEMIEMSRMIRER